MKNIFFIVCLCLILFQTGKCQWNQKIKLYSGGGVVLPQESFLLLDFFPNMIEDVYGVVDLDEYLIPQSSSSNFNTYWKTGLNISSGLEYTLHKNLNIRVGFQYAQFGFNQQQIKKDLNSLFENAGVGINVVNFSANRGTIGIYTVSINLKAHLPIGLITPYLIGGGGIMYLNQQPVEITSLTDPLGASFSYRIPDRNSGAIMGTGGAGFNINLSRVVQTYFEGNYTLGKSDEEDTIYYAIRAGLVFSLND